MIRNVFGRIADRFRPIPDIGADETWADELAGFTVVDDDFTQVMPMDEETAAAIAARVREESQLDEERLWAIELHERVRTIYDTMLDGVEELFWKAMGALRVDKHDAWEMLEEARGEEWKSSVDWASVPDRELEPV